MNRIYSYQTIKAAVEDTLLKEKGSKFLGFAFPLEQEEDIRRFLNQVREAHPKATHHCYAFRYGLQGENYRANDDGEPSGSAGLPIYNQLLAHDLTNILLIVVRYYGGTKLGVSGLVKAYKESAKITLDASEITTRELESSVRIQFNFDQQNLIFTVLNKFNGKIQDFLTDEQCTILAKVKTADREIIAEQLSEMQHVTFEFD